MNKNITNILLLSALSLSIVAIALNFMGGFRKYKLAYVEMPKVFSEYKGTKGYKAKLETFVSKQKTILDSMRLQVMALESSGQKDLYESKKEYYLKVYDEFTQNQSNLTQEYDTKIWNQIESNMKHFGEDKGYDFVFGDKGDGVFIYKSKSLNVTEEAITYLNNKFEGEK